MMLNPSVATARLDLGSFTMGTSSRLLIAATRPAASNARPNGTPRCRVRTAET